MGIFGRYGNGVCGILFIVDDPLEAREYTGIVEQRQRVEIAHIEEIPNVGEGRFDLDGVAMGYHRLTPMVIGIQTWAHPACVTIVPMPNVCFLVGFLTYRPRWHKGG